MSSFFLEIRLAFGVDYSR